MHSSEKFSTSMRLIFVRNLLDRCWFFYFSLWSSCSTLLSSSVFCPERGKDIQRKSYLKKEYSKTGYSKTRSYLNQLYLPPFNADILLQNEFKFFIYSFKSYSQLNQPVWHPFLPSLVTWTMFYLSPGTQRWNSEF